ncbi:glycoside hydrolase family 43 protein [Mucilaginibacter psychrotolerans]|uniref:Beta-glucanase n=1 Tax=Mucilaginibacter psychrotolerans TaxID=1524096 RepID=A0A4Y8SHK0_9SPHI|nr:glycoside hydrolase family 43 protein [Mucilaginibacter psychrotolerans]TFF38543.1 beta-glucanase [Mucilaginibacter psychrotolerans]
MNSYRFFILSRLFFACFGFIGMQQLHAQTTAHAGAGKFTPIAQWYDDKGVAINAHGGGILFKDNVYYWFGEHKVAGSAGNTSLVGVHCYSSTNLYNWKDEGIALPMSDDEQSDIVKGCVLERPKVIYNAKTKKYVMWFHLELKGKGYSAARTGLAVSDKPTGPYQYIRSYRPNAGKMPFYPKGTPDSDRVNTTIVKEQDKFFMRDFAGGQMARDMTLFVDDDGKAYHIFSSEENYTLHVAELNADYTAHTGKFSRVYIGQQTEAPAVFKRNGFYYMIGSGCTGWAPNAARLFRAKSIFGPWEYLGNPCIGPNSDLTYGGQSTHILNVNGKKDALIFMADKWEPKNAIDGRYIWLPITITGDIVNVVWKDSWDLGDLSK